MQVLNFDTRRFADILRDASKEAQSHLLRNNGVSMSSFKIFSLMNSAAVIVLSDRDILVPFFAKCRDSGVDAMIKRGERTPDDPIVNAFRSWFLASSVSDKDFMRLSRVARVYAFDITVQQQGFSAHSFSPIVRGEEDVVLPFFHVLIQECMHMKMEKAVLRHEKVHCAAALERAFAWYHFDLMYTYYKDKGVDVKNLI